jgi:cell wall-associated NlpC family hydrolase
MREHLVNLALKLVGCPYIWGGSNPWTGFDCSGFVVWVYQVFGLLPSGDWTAQELYKHFLAKLPQYSGASVAGDLIFYGRSSEGITHVMLSLGGDLCVGASGGDKLCTTAEIAQRRGAMVKVKPLHYRSDLVGLIHVAFPGE